MTKFRRKYTKKIKYVNIGKSFHYLLAIHAKLLNMTKIINEEKMLKSQKIRKYRKAFFLH